ncbi:arsenate reductase (glutaredoxin) [Parendozoicomonas haliclonae]|uniref:Arsenate reductase n=1 Tax=Parendozoicomonas haliclonae TaxID=1960125 RepID=A0A1X7AP84_9GAMM|nr:arsenate reductase (glutaredoxin) [Parendozoicomonas haliclonae]SMA50114.1 Arsenate reductase [Parendozoicomonas haliclonae]
MADVTIYHNPRCSKSRQTLQLLQEQDITPEIVLYLENTPDIKTLKAVLDKLDMSPRELLRKGEDAYKENNLKNPELTDQQLLEAMVAYPKLIERPIVLANGKARIGRPPESVLEIL